MTDHLKQGWYMWTQTHMPTCELTQTLNDIIFQCRKYFGMCCANSTIKWKYLERHCFHGAPLPWCWLVCRFEKPPTWCYTWFSHLGWIMRCTQVKSFVGCLVAVVCLLTGMVVMIEPYCCKMFWAIKWRTIFLKYIFAVEQVFLVPL